MVFHETSLEIYNWLQKQPHVKEESLTDWLLYYISESCSSVYYQAFTRHEEAKNGSDWEWWILTSNSSHVDEYNAYRFLVQAKKLFPDNADNYPLLSYGNKNGLQIDILMKTAKDKNALPLYMYYSIAAPNCTEQKLNFPWLNSDIINWCKECVNGCYLTLASKVYDLLYKMPRYKLTDLDLLNNALKFSLLDLLFTQDNIEIILSDFNSKILNMYRDLLDQKHNNGVIGIRHSGAGIPNYLKQFVRHGGKDVNWLESEMRLNDIDGIGVIDFRDNR